MILQNEQGSQSRAAYGKSDAVKQAWLVVYRNPKQHWDLYQLVLLCPKFNLGLDPLQ